MLFNFSFTVFNPVLNVITFISLEDVTDEVVEKLIDTLEEFGYEISDIKRERA